MWKEVDRVCGDKMPEFDDIPDLPVCRAVIKEVLRWRPVTAGGECLAQSLEHFEPGELIEGDGGVPHQSTKDDVYNGFFFKKGTNFHANQWYVRDSVQTLYF